MKYQMIGSVLEIRSSFVETQVSELSMLHSNFGGQNLWLASHRATQASHTGFHILQDNSSTIKVHVKRAPATPETE
jgi:flagellar biosynthesis component FlhA